MSLFHSFAAANMNPPLKYLLVSLAALFMLSCSSSTEKEVVAEDPEEVNELATKALTAKIAAIDTSHKFVYGKTDTLFAASWTKTFYSKRENKPAWIDKGKLNSAGDSLYRIVMNAIDWGLIAEDYHATLIDSFIRTSYDSTKEQYNVTHLANADMLLTDAFFTFAVHVSTGRMANDTVEVREWHPQRLDTNVFALIDDAVKNNRVKKVFESIEPKHPDYIAVKKFIPQFRNEFGKAKWDELPEIEKDTTAFLKALKPRLVAGHDYDSTTPGSDSLKLAEGLKKFQKRCGLEPDGKPGRLTRKALNMNVDERLRQMAVNLERWRLEPKKYPKQYLFVNIPAFEMRVWEADTVIMKSRIVVGAPKTQTPQLTSKISFMILYPYWHVPYSIAWKEMLPAIKRDTAYLRKKDFEVLDRSGKVVDPNTIDWKKVSRNNLPYKFRQRIGRGNSLGILKFDFPNRHGVYMHDTNSKSFFGYENRAQSHGCMRLEKYMDLAYFIIRDDSVKLPKDTFDLWMKEHSQRRVYAKKPLPIYVRYFTCYATDDNKILLLNDVYGRDERIMYVLYREADPKKRRYTAPGEARE